MSRADAGDFGYPGGFGPAGLRGLNTEMNRRLFNSSPGRKEKEFGLVLWECDSLDMWRLCVGPFMLSFVSISVSAVVFQKPQLPAWTHC